MEIIQHHQNTIDSMGIPDVVSYDPSYVPPVSPHLNHFKLKQIQRELTILNSRQKSPELTHLLCSVVEEKLFVVSKFIENFDRQFDQKEPEKEEEATVVEPTEDISQLRKRLLSGGTKTQMLDSHKENDYNESIQHSIMGELLEMTKVLKDSSVKFANSLAQDTQTLEKTSDNMLRNSDLFNNLNKNLTGYVENKTGYKISLFFLIKTTAALLVGFVIMVLLVKILPAL